MELIVQSLYTGTFYITREQFNTYYTQLLSKINIKTLNMIFIHDYPELVARASEVVYYYEFPCFSNISFKPRDFDSIKTIKVPDGPLPSFEFIKRCLNLKTLEISLNEDVDFCEVQLLAQLVPSLTLEIDYDTTPLLEYSELKEIISYNHTNVRFGFLRPSECEVDLAKHYDINILVVDEDTIDVPSILETSNVHNLFLSVPPLSREPSLFRINPKLSPNDIHLQHPPIPSSIQPIQLPTT
ncbi:unnamed protein product [Ambrosiozyma monospora]|uniref:Unnamed protein product n=1 Tax=Ambrosiozyma monospora TaxID=43982 RepID=A0ACB5TUV8_AMBMO|nr:unnamed protein product [Ambrosiozyma monospora]